MKKLMVSAMCAMMAAGAFAGPSWAMLVTDGAIGEEEKGYPERYAAYLCTQAKAAELFNGNKTTADITAYLANNYVDYAKGMTAMELYGGIAMCFDEGDYTFSKQYQEGTLADGDYIAVVAYTGVAGEDDMFRVFESAASDGYLEFDYWGSGTAGDWTKAAAAVPEPTSGLLLLLGVAGLALKRKRA